MNGEDRTAIVTGAGKRVGAVIAEALIERGWRVVAHVRRNEDEAPAATVKAVADLADPQCAEAIFAVTERLPPVRLLVNNAARFARDGFGDFSLAEFDAHMAVNLRAPLLLTEAFAARHEAGRDGLIVNILDSKIAAPNPDFLSYTLSKQALAGFTELAARALARRGIRVNGIAPALMLRSTGQSEENFRAMHDRNSLGRGVEPADVVRAIDYLLAATSVTGEVLTIDGGQRFNPPPRDVQFLSPSGDGQEAE
jgi:NAD(P)-dependent dehydrogenase (short-subunit alcohol dehydrogenase family)